MPRAKAGESLKYRDPESRGIGYWLILAVVTRTRGLTVRLLLRALYIDVQQLELTGVQATQVRFQRLLADRDVDCHHAEHRALANRALGVIVSL